MTPKDILRAEFDRLVSPRLESLGFRYSKSQFAYKRNKGVFTQAISITLSHHNSQESMHFWSSFEVGSPTYNQWLAKVGRERHEGSLGGCTDWNIPGWNATGAYSISLDFSDPNSRPKVLIEWLRRCESIGMPYLESLSSWEGAANDLVRRNWHWNRAADYQVIAGNPRLAAEALESGIAFLSKRDFSYSENAHPILVRKKLRQAAERDAEIESFRRRIHELLGNPSNDAAL